MVRFIGLVLLAVACGGRPRAPNGSLECLDVGQPAYSDDVECCEPYICTADFVCAVEPIVTSPIDGGLR